MASSSSARRHQQRLLNPSQLTIPGSGKKFPVTLYPHTYMAYNAPWASAAGEGVHWHPRETLRLFELYTAAKATSNNEKREETGAMATKAGGGVDVSESNWSEWARIMQEELGAYRPVDFFTPKNLRQELNRVFDLPNPEHAVTGVLPKRGRSMEAAQQWVLHYRKEVERDAEATNHSIDISMRHVLDIIERAKRGAISSDEMATILESWRARDAQRPNAEEYERSVQKLMAETSVDVRSINTINDLAEIWKKDLGIGEEDEEEGNEVGEERKEGEQPELIALRAKNIAGSKSPDGPRLISSPAIGSPLPMPIKYPAAPVPSITVTTTVGSPNNNMGTASPAAAARSRHPSTAATPSVVLSPRGMLMGTPPPHSSGAAGSGGGMSPERWPTPKKPVAAAHVSPVSQESPELGQQAAAMRAGAIMEQPPQAKSSPSASTAAQMLTPSSNKRALVSQLQKHKEKLGEKTTTTITTAEEPSAAEGRGLRGRGRRSDAVLVDPLPPPTRRRRRNEAPPSAASSSTASVDLNEATNAMETAPSPSTSAAISPPPPKRSKRLHNKTSTPPPPSTSTTPRKKVVEKVEVVEPEHDDYEEQQSAPSTPTSGILQLQPAAAVGIAIPPPMPSSGGAAVVKIISPTARPSRQLTPTAAAAAALAGPSSSLGMVASMYENLTPPTPRLATAVVRAGKATGAAAREAKKEMLLLEEEEEEKTIPPTTATLKMLQVPVKGEEAENGGGGDQLVLEAPEEWVVEDEETDDELEAALWCRENTVSDGSVFSTIGTQTNVSVQHSISNEGESPPTSTAPSPRGRRSLIRSAGGSGGGSRGRRGGSAQKGGGGRPSRTASWSPAPKTKITKSVQTMCASFDSENDTVVIQSIGRRRPYQSEERLQSSSQQLAMDTVAEIEAENLAEEEAAAPAAVTAASKQMTSRTLPTPSKGRQGVGRGSGGGDRTGTRREKRAGGELAVNIAAESPGDSFAGGEEEIPEQFVRVVYLPKLTVTSEPTKEEIKALKVKRPGSSQGSTNNRRATRRVDEHNFHTWEAPPRSLLQSIWKEIQANKHATGFITPVSEAEVPHYYTVIRKPVSLAGIKKGIDTGAIKTFGKLMDAVAQMCANAVIFNAEHHLINIDAKALLQYALKWIDNVQHPSQSHSVGTRISAASTSGAILPAAAGGNSFTGRRSSYGVHAAASRGGAHNQHRAGSSTSSIKREETGAGSHASSDYYDCYPMAASVAQAAGSSTAGSQRATSPPSSVVDGDSEVKVEETEDFAAMAPPALPPSSSSSMLEGGSGVAATTARRGLKRKQAMVTDGEDEGEEGEEKGNNDDGGDDGSSQKSLKVAGPSSSSNTSSLITVARGGGGVSAHSFPSSASASASPAKRRRGTPSILSSSHSHSHYSSSTAAGGGRAATTTARQQLHPPSLLPEVTTISTGGGDLPSFSIAEVVVGGGGGGGGGDRSDRSRHSSGSTTVLSGMGGGGGGGGGKRTSGGSTHRGSGGGGGAKKGGSGGGGLPPQSGGSPLQRHPSVVVNAGGLSPKKASAKRTTSTARAAATASTSSTAPAGTTISTQPQLQRRRGGSGGGAGAGVGGGRGGKGGVGTRSRRD